NHTTGMLEISGTATVSADGKTVTTDPGSGIVSPGWFGVTPPGDCGGDGGAPEQPGPADTRPGLAPILLPLLTGDDGIFKLAPFTENEQDPAPLPPPPPGCPPPEKPATPFLHVIIEVDGPLSDFMSQTGTLPMDFASFDLFYGQTETFSAQARTF